MKNNLPKSILAILAGFIFVVVASLITDMALIKTGIMKQPFNLNTTGFIGLVILYRCLYGIAGSYITAKLAPKNAMKHAMAGGLFGLCIAVLGAVMMWDIPPRWYPITLILTTLPCAWIGGLLFEKQNRHDKLAENIPVEK